MGAINARASSFFMHCGEQKMLSVAKKPFSEAAGKRLSKDGRRLQVDVPTAIHKPLYPA